MIGGIVFQGQPLCRPRWPGILAARSLVGDGDWRLKFACSIGGHNAASGPPLWV